MVTMIIDSESQKRALAAQVTAELEQRLTAGKARMAARFAEQFMRRVPIEDLAAAAPSTLATIVIRQLELMRHRGPGEMLIRVYNPTPEREGWESAHTIVELVNDDMPFLVDTGALTLSELGLGIHLITHPVIRVARDADGKLTGLYDKQTKRGSAESVIQFQVDRRTSKTALQEIEGRLLAAFRDVHRAVADWKAMEEKAKDAESLLPQWAGIHWLLEDHFIFLGVRDYRVVRANKAYELQLVPGSGLGILREDADTVTSRPLSSLADVARKRRQKLPLIITKTNARSTVHRAGYLDYIGVLRRLHRGTPFRQAGPNGRRTAIPGAVYFVRL
jgi:glutamate dehydrogenase